MGRKIRSREFKAGFAKRLRGALEEKGWTAGQAAREAQRLVPDRTIGSAHLSHWLNGRVIPSPVYLQALSHALEVSPEELLGEENSKSAPAASTNGAARHTPLPAHRSSGLVEVRDLDDGNAWMEIRQGVPWPLAIEILKLLKS
jgi:transcriptional regulator with XRE-family HTH domain